LDWEGASLEGLTWTDLKDLVRAFHESARAMSPDVNPERLVPIKLQDGSVEAVLRVPSDLKPGFAKILAGPTRAWTAKDYVAAEPIQRFIRKRAGGSMSYKLGRGKERNLVLFDPRQAPPLVHSTSRFFVLIAGLGAKGDTPWVKVRLGGGERTIQAQVRSDSLVTEAAHLFWKNAFVTLEYGLDPVTGDMLKASLIAIEPYKHVSLYEHVISGGTVNLATQYKSMDELLVERRGGA
jgi:hypothetical protein